MKVCKFGGSSVAENEALSKVIKKIKEDDERSIIVVSAPGKRDKNDMKLTDELISKCNAECTICNNNKIIKSLRERFECFSVNLEEELKLIKQQLMKKTSLDFILSRGEYLMSKVLAKKLNYNWVDAKDIIKFKNLEVEVDDSKLAPKTVLGGFYGSDEEDNIKTFPRGGGDITGALIAAKLKAEVYEIFTDVDGVYDTIESMKLRLDSSGRILNKLYKELSYNQLVEIAEAGAEVVQLDAVKICKENGIKLMVKNTFSSEEGTVIHG